MFFWTWASKNSTKMRSDCNFWDYKGYLRDSRWPKFCEGCKGKCHGTICHIISRKTLNNKFLLEILVNQLTLNIQKFHKKQKGYNLKILSSVFFIPFRCHGIWDLRQLDITSWNEKKTNTSNPFRREFINVWHFLNS